MIRLYNEDKDSVTVKEIFEQNGFYTQNEEAAEITDTHTYVFEEDSGVVGAICFARNLPPRLVNGLMAREVISEGDHACVINAMVVRESHRRLGIGMALMHFAFAKDCRCTKIVLAARPGTEPYYQRAGFVLTGLKTFGHHVMMLPRGLERATGFEPV